MPRVKWALSKFGSILPSVSSRSKANTASAPSLLSLVGKSLRPRCPWKSDGFPVSTTLIARLSHSFERVLCDEEPLEFSINTGP